MRTKWLVATLILSSALTSRATGIRALGLTDLAPDTGSHFEWNYVVDAEVLFFPVLRSTQLKKLDDITMDSWRSPALDRLRTAFPQIEWDMSSVFPSNKKGVLARNRVKLTAMVPFVVEACQTAGARSGLIGRMSWKATQNVWLYECELVLVDAEAGCAVTSVKGWADAETGPQAAFDKSVELLTEHHLYVVRPRISLTVLHDDKGRRSGASIPVGSRLGFVKDSTLVILGEKEDGSPSAIGVLEVEEEGKHSSVCDVKGIQRKTVLNDGTLCIPVDEDTYRDYKPKKKRRKAGR